MIITYSWRCCPGNPEVNFAYTARIYINLDELLQAYHENLMVVQLGIFT